MVDKLTLDDLEKLMLKRKVFVGREISDEGYEEVVANIHKMSLNQLTDIAREAVRNKKLLVLLALSDALLRKPSLYRSLTLNFTKRKDSELANLFFYVDRSVLQLGLETIDEDALEAVKECQKYAGTGVSKDIRKCREQYASLLFGIKNTAIELLTAIVPLGLTPSYVRIKPAETNAHIRKYCVLWPYVVEFRGRPFSIVWHLSDKEKLRVPIDLDSEVKVNYARGVALKDSVAFVVNVSETEEHVIFSSLDGKVKHIKAMKVCQDDFNRLYALQRNGDNLVLVAYDHEGIEIYEKVTNVSLNDIRLVSCVPLSSGGAVFNIVASGKSRLIAFKDGKVGNVSIEGVIHHLVSMPLDVVIGLAESEIVISWIIPRGKELEVVKEEVKRKLPKISGVLPVPHLGILIISSEGAYRSNGIGSTIPIPGLFPEPPRSLEAVRTPTFSLLWTRDKSGSISKLFYWKDGILGIVDVERLEESPVEDIVYDDKTMCLVLKNGLLNCFSPIYVKIYVKYIKAVDSEIPEKLTSSSLVQDLLSLYRESKTPLALTQLVYAGCKLLDTQKLDGLLHEISNAIAYVKKSVRETAWIDLEAMLVKAIRYNLSLDILKLVLHEYFSKTADVYEDLQVVVLLTTEKLGSTDVKLLFNVDAIRSVSSAYRVLSDYDKVKQLKLNHVLKLLAKLSGGIELLGVRSLTVKELLNLLPSRSADFIIRNLVSRGMYETKEPDKHVTREYLKEFGIDIDLVVSEISLLQKLALELNLENLDKTIERKIDVMIDKNSVQDLSKSLESLIGLLSKAKELVDRYSPLFGTDVTQEVKEILSISFVIDEDEKSSIKKLERIEFCYEELSKVFRDFQTTISESRIKFPSSSETSSYLARYVSEVRTCEEKLKKANFFNQLISQLDRKLEALEHFAVKPLAINDIVNAVVDHIGSLNLEGVREMLLRLERYFTITESFNSALSKLEKLVSEATFDDARQLLREFVQEFTNLDLGTEIPEHLEELNRRIVGIRELDVDKVSRCISSIRDSLKHIQVNHKLVEDVIREIFRVFIFKLVKADASQSIAFLRKVDKDLKLLQERLSEYDRLIDEKLAPKLREVVNDENLAAKILKKWAEACDTVRSISASDVVTRLNDIINTISTEKERVAEVVYNIENLSQKLRILDPLIKEILQRSIASSIARMEDYSLKSLNNLLTQFTASIKEDRLLEKISRYVGDLKRKQATVASTTARKLLNEVVDVSLNHVAERRFAEAINTLEYGYRLYSVLKYEFDELLIKLERAGLESSRLVRVVSGDYQSTINEFINSMRILNDIVTPLLEKCPEQVARLINHSGGVSEKTISSLRILQNVDKPPEAICEILREARFENIEGSLAEALAKYSR